MKVYELSERERALFNPFGKTAAALLEEYREGMYRTEFVVAVLKYWNDIVALNSRDFMRQNPDYKEEVTHE